MYSYDGPQPCIRGEVTSGAETELRSQDNQWGIWPALHTRCFSCWGGDPRTAMLVADNWCPQPALFTDSLSRLAKMASFTPLTTIFPLWPKHEHCCLQQSVPYPECKCMAETCPEELVLLLWATRLCRGCTDLAIFHRPGQHNHVTNKPPRHELSATTALCWG